MGNWKKKEKKKKKKKKKGGEKHAIDDPFLPKDFNVRQMAVGEHHILLLTDSGHLWSFGNAECGQLGLGEMSKPRTSPKLIMFLTDTPITSVAAAGNHSACLVRRKEWDVNAFFLHAFFLFVFLKGRTWKAVGMGTDHGK